MNSRLKEIFLEIIAIEGTSGDERKVADYILSFLKKLGLSPFEDSTAAISKGNTGNILCPVGDGGNFVMLSHMDTARSTKDVKAIFHEDRITSDGKTVLGVDNRAGIASLLFAIEKLFEEKIPLKDFTLAFTIQEETTLNGSLNIELNEKIKMGFIFDSHLRTGNFICESAGAKGFEAKIKGKASHSGLAPEMGIDSIKIASNAICKIELGRIDKNSTANIGIIKGGSATNVVPETTVAEGEVRSMIPEFIENKITEIENTFVKCANMFGGEVEFNSFWNFKPYCVPENSETYKTIVHAISSCGLNPIKSISKGGSDANSLNAKGIQSVNLGIGAENPHSNDEYILYEDFTNSTLIAMELMKK